MDTNKILSADLLDLVFDDRNKAYGAYDLRVTYPQRIKKAMIITGSLAILVFSGAVLANSIKPDVDKEIIVKEMTLENITPEVDIPEPEPEEVPPPEEQQEQTVQLTTPVLTDIVETPPPTQTDIAEAKIDTKTVEGVPDDGIPDEKKISDGTGIIEAKPVENPDEPHVTVEVEARFDGNWNRFLERNLNANVPVDNGAAPGRYKIMVQFIVDREGNVSEIKPLSTVGYGMEQEAVRVLKKAQKWVPAIQNGYKVKAYRTQVIIFEVVEE